MPVFEIEVGLVAAAAAAISARNWNKLVKNGS